MQARPHLAGALILVVALGALLVGLGVGRRSGGGPAGAESAGVAGSVPARPPAPAARPAASSPPLVLVDPDVSGSMTPEERRKLFGMLYMAFERVLPSRSRYVVCTFADKVQKLYEGQPYATRDLWKVEDEIASPTAPAKENGTYPSRVLEQNLVDLAQAEAGQDAIVMLLWDGEDADPTATRAAAAKLAEVPNLRAVWVIGVTTELYAPVQRTFAALGDRLIVSSPLSLEQGLDDFQRKLRERRP